MRTLQSERIKRTKHVFWEKKPSQPFDKPGTVMGLAVIEDALESTGKKMTAYKVLIQLVYVSLLSTLVSVAIIITGMLVAFKHCPQPCSRSEIAYNTVHATSSCLAFKVAL